MTPRDTTLTDLEFTATDAVATDVPLQMDEETFRGFYDRTARMLWSYLYRLTGDRAQADDLLQESYYRLLRATVALETESHRRHYVFRIATNLATDGVRRRLRRPEQVDQDLDRIGVDPGDAMDRTLDLKSALSRLRHRDRAMLLLAYAQGASHAEIGHVVGVGTTSVKPLLYRARRRLAGLLRRPGGSR